MLCCTRRFAEKARDETSSNEGVKEEHNINTHRRAHVRRVQHSQKKTDRNRKKREVEKR